MSTDLLPIGAVSSATGVSISALRYYEDIGVIANVGRVGGKRRFHPDTVGRVSFVRRAQDVGFTLDEIRALLDDRRGDWVDLVEAKLHELRSRRERLDMMIGVLGEMQACGCEVVATCDRVDW